jgi:hypothetical protein
MEGRHREDQLSDANLARTILVEGRSCDGPLSLLARLDLKCIADGIARGGYATSLCWSRHRSWVLLVLASVVDGTTIDGAFRWEPQFTVAAHPVGVYLRHPKRIRSAPLLLESIACMRPAPGTPKARPAVASRSPTSGTRSTAWRRNMSPTRRRSTPSPSNPGRESRRGRSLNYSASFSRCFVGVTWA